MTITTRVIIPNDADYRVTLRMLLAILQKWGFGSTEERDGQVIVVFNTGGKPAQLTIEQRKEILAALPAVQLLDSWAAHPYYRP